MTFETTSRNLEQWLYMHFIKYVSLRKNEDGMTVWIYTRDEELERVVAEYKFVLEKKARFFREARQECVK